MYIAVDLKWHFTLSVRNVPVVLHVSNEEYTSSDAQVQPKRHTGFHLRP